MLSACDNHKTQAESTDTEADPTEMMANDSTQRNPLTYCLTGTIGEEKASITLEMNGNNVTGIVTRCDYCEPIDVKGTYQDDNIKVEGFSLAGSHIRYELTVIDNTVQGTEFLSAEGEIEKQNVKLKIGKR